MRYNLKVHFAFHLIQPASKPWAHGKLYINDWVQGNYNNSHRKAENKREIPGVEIISLMYYTLYKHLLFTYQDLSDEKPKKATCLARGIRKFLSFGNRTDCKAILLIEITVYPLTLSQRVFSLLFKVRSKSFSKHLTSKKIHFIIGIPVQNPWMHVTLTLYRHCSNSSYEIFLISIFPLHFHHYLGLHQKERKFKYLTK